MLSDPSEPPGGETDRLQQCELQKIFLKLSRMKGFLLLAIYAACLLKTSTGVRVAELNRIFDQAPYGYWAALAANRGKKPQSGRSGDIDIDVDPQFFDEFCKPKVEVLKNGDVCFVVQTSCRNNKKDFQNVMKSITNDMADILTELDDQTMYSTVTYSGTTKIVAKWRQNLGKINTGKLKGGKLCEDCRARTDLAIDQCKEMFDDKKIAGRDVPKTIVLFTDGVSFDSKYQNQNITRDLTNQKLIQIHNENKISLQVVRIKEDPGATIEVDYEWPQMNHISGEMKDTVNIDDLGEKDDQDVDIRIVGEVEIDDPELMTPCCTADVVFVLDTSDSITKKDVALLLDFIHGFIEVQLKIIDPNALDKHEGLQIAVLTYCGTVKIVANLGEQGREELMLTIDAINRDTVNCHYTSTHLALREAYAQLTGPNQRIAPHVRKIVVLATDGRTWKVGHNKVYGGPDTIDAAQKIKDDLKGEVFVVGLPNYKQRPDVGEWMAMSSPPKNCTFVDMREGTFEDLNSVGKYLTKKICLQSNAEFCYFDYDHNVNND
ncbi:unnamed protein product [Owenia fusiformis]|uniref:Uncharacterized protein n=1 Tax=Owenia fusiformis TaxID=6347 RepID=A0A8J1YCR7_OWEFU|nr:unnamed protein product [Owenia fusiformis]